MILYRAYYRLCPVFGTFPGIPDRLTAWADSIPPLYRHGAGEGGCTLFAALIGGGAGETLHTMRHDVSAVDRFNAQPMRPGFLPPYVATAT